MGGVVGFLRVFMDLSREFTGFHEGVWVFLVLIYFVS